MALSDLFPEDLTGIDLEAETEDLIIRIAERTGRSPEEVRQTIQEDDTKETKKPRRKKS